MENLTTQEPRAKPSHGYRGRVRSGCLTCRSRKIKCDELRPICNNCTKFRRRDCIYKVQPPSRREPSYVSTPESSTQNEVTDSPAERRSVSSSVLETSPKPSSEENNNYEGDAHQCVDEAEASGDALHIGLLSPETSFAKECGSSGASSQHPDTLSIMAEDPEFDISSPSNLISRDIKLTTTMDMLTAGEVSFQLSFDFFLETVDCPAITPYDSVNWRHMKLHVIELGKSNAAISSAIIAISALYKAQMYGLPNSKALSLYQSSLHSYEKLLSHPDHNFEAVVVTVFLQCIFQFVSYETAPFLREPSESLIANLRIWGRNPSAHSELHSRIVIWLKLLYTTTIRGGGLGLISETIYDILPDYHLGPPHIKSPAPHVSNTSNQLLQILSAPIFDFYFNLQMISGEIARLTHYHRSRTTGRDQEEVMQKVTSIKTRLLNLWENRSATQTQTSADLLSHLAPEIANPLISLNGICSAAYHTEFVELGRLMGDPVSKSTDSKQAMRQIREIVDGDSNAYDGERLNPAYLRPLFLYTIECMDRDETQWAVHKMKQIRSSISRSDFFASFGQALSNAQTMKDRRVTSKYFCIWFFGVSPPFL